MWYAAVAVGVLLFGIAGDAGAILFLPLMLGLVFVGFWAFDVK